MDPAASGPAIHYYMIRGGADKRNITVWDCGTAGNEYIKAYGHYHIDNLDETYTILAGEGILIIQERAKGASGAGKAGALIDDEIVSFKALRVRAGDSILIPPRSGHSLVNTGNTWLVTSDDSPFTTDDLAGMPKHADYEPVKKLHGMAYYVIEKDGQPTLVKNPAYASVPKAEITDFKA